MAKESDESILGAMREIGTELVEKLKGIDSDLLMTVSNGDPKSANYSRTAQIESSAPTSALAAPEGWNQIAWWKSFPDGHTWTDVWGKRPPQR